MHYADPFTIRLRVPSDTGRARRAVRELADRYGASEEGASACAHVAAELGTNLLRYASKGVLCAYAEARGIAIVASDDGPGIADVAHAMTDGSSERESLGVGLGAVRRASDVFELVTSEQGTIVVAIVRTRDHSATTQVSRWDVGSSLIPARGEPVSGDSWASFERPNGTLDLVVVDGLGHGTLANAAAVRAVESDWHQDEDPAAFLRRTHECLRGSRGAATMALRVKRDESQLRVTGAGIGNVSARLVHPSQPGLTLSSQPGILGRTLPKLRMEQRVAPPDACLIVCTDGVTSEWIRYTERRTQRGSSVLYAAQLLQALGRGRDDATCVVVRKNGSS